MKRLIRKKLDKIKKQEFIAHSKQIESLLLKEKVVFDTQAIISKVSSTKPEEHELVNFLDDVYCLEKLSNLLRAQMLVSIFGYFEFSIKKMALLEGYEPLRKLNTAVRIIDTLSPKNMNIIDSDTTETLHQYRKIRNACTHQNQSSAKKDSDLDKAAQYLPGFKIKGEHGTGKGQIELDDTFLFKAIDTHFKVLEKL